MLELAVLIAVDLALIAAVMILRSPKLLLPIVVLGLPIEYFATVTLDTFGEGGIRGAVRAFLVPGKAAMLAVVLFAVFRSRHRPLALFPNSAMVIPLAVLAIVIVIGVAWSDSLDPPNSVLILMLYVAFAFAAPMFIEDRRDLERIWGCMFAIAMFLSVVAVAQRFGVFNWRAVLVQSDEVSYRSNATFGDPNILARYLAMVIPLAVALILATGARRLTLLAIPALFLSLLGIIASASRSGWLMLVMVGFLTVLFAPIRRSLKVELTVVAVAIVSAGLGLLLFNGGADAERVRTLTRVSEVIGQREFLIRAGWEMWKDNPFIGVGSGNYQHALQTSYLDQIPTWARTTLSHTSFVSILAEVGIVGAALFVFVALRVGLTVGRTYFATKDPYNRLITGWLGASLIGVMFHTQSEGRLLDEPYLWFLIALVIAFETRFARRVVESAVAREVVVSVEPAAGMPTPEGQRGARPIPAPVGVVTTHQTIEPQPGGGA